MGDRLGLGFSFAKQFRDDPLDPVPQIGRAVLPAGQDLLAVAGQKLVQPFVYRRNRQGKLASREGQRIVSRAETNGTAEEPLKLCNFEVARMTERDLDGVQPGVGEKSDGSNEIRCCELHGLSWRGQPSIGKLEVDRCLSRRELHVYINGFVQDVRVSLHDL